MKYYLIAGEASGDLHASHLITSLKQRDAQAEFRFFGGDNMAAAAGGSGTLVRHYNTLAYMGFVPVMMHLPEIMRGMRECKADIEAYNPDAVILIDYAGFNLKIAEYVKTHLPHISVVYYISPKIWAWKEYRIKSFKRYVDLMLCILPFEKDFFETKHQYPVNYVGNPTAAEVAEFIKQSAEAPDDFYSVNGISPDVPIIALLAGSRRQEIKDNLPAMLKATSHLANQYQIIIAGAPSIEPEYYSRFTQGHERVRLLRKGQTYPLLLHSHAALVTSGTATLETALFNVPQVVCYKTPLPHFMRWAFNHIITCPYISLVNLVAGREVVKELFADRFSTDNIRCELEAILGNTPERRNMLGGYHDVQQTLGNSSAPDSAATAILQHIRKKQEAN